MLKIKCWVDAIGLPRAEISSPWEMVGWFLEQDIQSDFEDCKEIISICQKIEARKLSSWEGTGNAHTVSISPLGVHISNEFTEDKTGQPVPIAGFITALQTWAEFIKTKSKKSE